MKKIMKKFAVLFILLAVCTAGFAGCKKSEETGDNKTKDNEPTVSAEKTVDMKSLKESMLAADGSLPEMSVVYGSDENGPDLFGYLAEYEYGNVEDYFFAYAAAGTAEEVAVIRLKDVKSAEECLAAVQKHVESRIIQFRTYDPSQVERCEKAIVFSNEVYVVLIISDGQDDIKEAFYSAFSE